MKKIKKLYIESAEIIALNTLISCRGVNLAPSAYVDNCKRCERPVKQWALDYFSEYKKRAGKKAPLDNYIDVRACALAIDFINEGRYEE